MPLRTPGALEAKAVGFRYTAKTPWVLRGVNFTAAAGERVGIVAPSGTGKTTLVKLLAGYERPGEGTVLLDGAPLPARGAAPVQLIGQLPEQAINPRWKLRRALAEAGQLNDAVMAALGIEPEWLERYPRELSGGELQRFCIARALGAATRYLVADEISTMLDAVTQAQIWHHLLAEAGRRGIGLIVVTHSPALAQRVCTRVVDLRDLNRVAAHENAFEAG